MLSEIDMSKVTEIGARAFEYCSSLTSVTIRAEKPPTVSGYSFYSTPDTLKFYVPADKVDTYKAANVWSSTTYVNKIEAIPEPEV
jgi:hypothetical protein